MIKIVVAGLIMLGAITLAAAQQETPAPGVPPRPGVPDVATQPGLPPGHPAPMAGQQVPVPARPAPIPGQQAPMPVHPAPMAGQQTPLPAHPAPNISGQTPRAPHPPMPDLMHDVMFPPDMILGHARQLNLTNDQKAFMRAEIQKTTTSFHELQWNLQDQMELLHEMMKAPSVVEEQVLGQLNRVLDIEREIKRLHFGMAVRLKNKLTPAQQEELHKLRRMGQHMGMPGVPPPQPTIANPIP
jgi:Spy/CpxP family protein refolding chaperone